ncbi:hypothetical protein [Deinococcus rubellus]|uniref:hypothetical protein n=1 Tax=Deinococcus rubellus TaxID=1889240 RepID=UPI0031E784DC
MNEKPTAQTMLSHISTATGLHKATALQRRLSASGKTYLIVLNDPEAETYFVATVAETCALVEAGYEVFEGGFIGTLPQVFAHFAESGVTEIDFGGGALRLDWRYAVYVSPHDAKLLELSILDHPEGGSVHLGHARLG